MNTIALGNRWHLWWSKCHQWWCGVRVFRDHHDWQVSANIVFFEVGFEWVRREMRPDLPKESWWFNLERY